MKRHTPWILVVAACIPSDDGVPAPDASPTDAIADAGSSDGADVDKAATCASTFGTMLTNAFGRVDGTVLAVVPPAHPTCAAPNATHLVLQVTMNGAAHRMVINVKSNGSDSRVFGEEVDAPLVGGAWSEGWHPGAQLNYASTLGTSSTTFQPYTTAEAVAHLTDELQLGARVSVFATSSGGALAGSAHLIHRNTGNADGAIVVNPDTAPRYLLLRFATQSF